MKYLVCRYLGNVSSHTCFSKNNATASYSTLKCVLCQNVFVLVCVISPTASLTNSISTPRVASWWTTQRIEAMEAIKRTGSEIADSTRPKCLGIHLKNSDQRNIKTWLNQFVNLQCHCQLGSFLSRTVHCLNTACENLCRSSVFTWSSITCWVSFFPIK